MTFRISTLVVGLAVATSALAEDAITSITTRSGWEIGGQVSNYRYEEPDVNVSLGGAQLAVRGAYTGKIGPDGFWRVDLRHAYGELRYEGSGTMGGVPNTVFEARAALGTDIVAESVALSPYIGIGYRYLYNDLRGTTSTGAVGYRRYSSYLYVPVGFTLRFRTASAWVVAPTLEYDYFVGGRQDSWLSDTGIGYSDARNRQDKGYGYRAALMFERRHLAFGPWAQVWKIDDSDIVPIGLGRAGLEPANKTREAGVELKYRF